MAKHSNGEAVAAQVDAVDKKQQSVVLNGFARCIDRVGSTLRYFVSTAC
jgi:hypothetical protein